MNEEEKQAYNYLEKYIKWETLGERNLEGDIKTILNLIEKQQTQIEILKDNLKEERSFNKSALETLKDCVNKDYLHKMISFKDGEIEKLKEAYQILKDDIEGHRIVYVDTPEFKEKYISKDKIKELIEEQKKFLSKESSKYDEDDIEHRKAIQYASARLSFLLADIYKLGE